MEIETASLDLSYSFDNSLRDRPNKPHDVRKAIAILQKQAKTNAPDLRDRIKCLGLIGVYTRQLGELETAQNTLESAVSLAQSLNDSRLEVANTIRLAIVYQWQHRYEESETLLFNVIKRCEKDQDVKVYLDFAYQHLGKCKFDQQDYAIARQYLQAALAIRQQKQDDSLIQSTQIAIAIVESKLSQ